MLMRPNKAEAAQLSAHGCHCPGTHALGTGQTVGWCLSVSCAVIVFQHHVVIYLFSKLHFMKIQIVVYTKIFA